MSNKAPKKQKLFAELKRLRREVDDLKENKQDLEILLETVAQHADTIQDNLLEAQEAAVKNTHAKSSFLANMSHEIRTPISGVIGMTGLLLDTPLTEEQQDYVNTIRISGDALLNIINDILDFSKIEAGKLELEEQPFDLRACVEESLDLLTSKAMQKGLNLTYMIAENTPDILIGDINRLRQILVNLLGNAVKFTSRGEVTVSVTARNAKTNDVAHEVHFAVQDTGIGIPSDRIQRLFHSFTQANASTTREFGGTGLGLAISKRLSELMGGRIWIESEKNKGSVFHFTIKARAEQERPYAWLWRTDPQLAGKRLLICCENAANRNIVACYAGHWGMFTKEMQLSALEKKQVSDVFHQNDRWDVAILDTHLPAMEIPGLLDSISNTLPSLPLAALVSTCHSLPSTQEGFAGCLAKPLKPAKLHAVLKEILGGRPPHVADIAARTVTQPEKKQTDKTKVRILLAEDNPVNQKVALLILKKLGCHADVVCDGLEALEALDRQSYDVVFMDVQMPNMDGLAATRRIIEKWPAAQRPWIIAMTANAMQGDRELCLEAGMNDYLSKPIRPQELAKALAAYTERQ
ncbi:MAG: response regulator [Gammaproteobacteria bacterium]|nr:response regulator [Gammaproteobacteria bacterium]